MHLSTESLKNVFDGCLTLDYSPSIFAFVIIPPKNLDELGGIESLIELHSLSSDRICVIAPFVCLNQSIRIGRAQRISRVDDHLVEMTKDLITGLPSPHDFHRENTTRFIAEWHKQNYEFLRMLRIPSCAMPCIVVTEKLAEPTSIIYKSFTSGLSEDFRILSDFLWRECGWHAIRERDHKEWEISRLERELRKPAIEEDLPEFRKLIAASRDPQRSRKRLLMRKLNS